MPDYDLVPVDYQPDWSDLPAPHGVPQLSVGPQQPLDPIASNTPTSLVPQAALNAVQPAVQGAVDWAAAPGKVLQSQGPQAGQSWTDEDEALRQLNAEAAPQWGAQTAMNMVGVGTPFAETGAAGVTGGKLGLPMDEASRMARAADQGYEGPWYHGSMRTDRLTDSGKIDPRRATSGPMPFFSNDPEMASGYAMGKKGDTSLEDYGDVRQYFTVDPKDVMRGRALVRR